jgi:hypothetical protein
MNFEDILTPQEQEIKLAAFSQNLRSGVASDSGLKDLKIESDKPFSLNGNPGRDIMATTKGIQAGAVLFRVVAVGDRIYMSIVGGDEMRSGNSAIKMFQDSFQITYKPVDPADVHPEDGWGPITDADGFTGEMPGRAAAPASKTTTRPVSKNRPTSWGIYSSRSGYFSIDFRGIPESTPVEQVLTEAAERFKSTPHPQVARDLPAPTESAIDLYGLPGKQLVYTHGDNRKNGAIVRFFAVGNRLYTLLASGKAMTISAPKAKRFFETFQITYKPSAPIAMSSPPAKTSPPAQEPAVVITPMPTPPPNNVPMRPRPVTPVSPPPGTDPVPSPSPIPNTGLETNVKLLNQIDPFWAIAFAPSKSEVLTISGRLANGKAAGLLQRYSYPDFKIKGRYNLPNLASKAVFDDKTGILYIAALTKAETLVAKKLDYDRAYGDGNIQIFDLNPVFDGTIPDGADLRLPGVVNGVGKPVAIELSPDGKTLYALGEFEVKGFKGGFNARLYQIDTAKKAVVKDMALPEPTRDMTASADGKRLYLTEWPIGANSVPIPGKAPGVVVVDTEAWSRLPTLRLPSFTTDLAVSPAGKIAAVCVDLTGSRVVSINPDGNPASDYRNQGGSAIAGYVRFAAGGKRLIVSSAFGQGGVDIYDVNNLELQRVGTATPTQDLPLSGHFRMTPDGTMAIFQTGAVVDVANVGK